VPQEVAGYCFAYSAAIPDERVAACPDCGRRRWVVGDFAQLACAGERGKVVRNQRYMTTVFEGGKVLHEWRCMKCITDETHTDAFTHFPDESTTTT
jgi:hypothetical protein